MHELSFYRSVNIGAYVCSELYYVFFQEKILKLMFFHKKRSLRSKNILDKCFIKQFIDKEGNSYSGRTYSEMFCGPDTANFTSHGLENNSRNG